MIENRKITGGPALFGTTEHNCQITGAMEQQQLETILVMPPPPPTYDEAVQGTPNEITPVQDEEENQALAGHPNVPSQEGEQCVVPHEPIYVPSTFNYAYYAMPLNSHGRVIHKAWTADGQRKSSRCFNWCMFLVALGVLVCCIIFLIRLTAMEKSMKKP